MQDLDPCPGQVGVFTEVAAPGTSPAAPLEEPMHVAGHGVEGDSGAQVLLNIWDVGIQYLVAVRRLVEVAKDDPVCLGENPGVLIGLPADHDPVQALQEYRRKLGIPAKLVVVGMTANGFSIADPNDGGMLDVVGFDAATPQLISDFIAG